MDISLVADILTGCADFKLENDNQAVSCRNNDLLIQLWFLIKKTVNSDLQVQTRNHSHQFGKSLCMNR